MEEWEFDQGKCWDSCPNGGKPLYLHYWELDLAIDHKVIPLGKGLSFTMDFTSIYTREGEGIPNYRYFASFFRQENALDRLRLRASHQAEFGLVGSYWDGWDRYVKLSYATRHNNTGRRLPQVATLPEDGAFQKALRNALADNYRHACSGTWLPPENPRQWCSVQTVAVSRRR